MVLGWHIDDVDCFDVEPYAPIMEQKTPIFLSDYEEAIRCLAALPHIIGGTSLFAAVGLMTSIVAIAKSTIVLCWLLGVGYAVLGYIGAEDIVTAWERGEGWWYRRGRDDEELEGG